ncbi:MAG: DUF2975 domain-containing protein, partial [Clostridiales bacterium]|nr:DUF2975 domain-containing protein [Clostridiales bacterium]
FFILLLLVPSISKWYSNISVKNGLIKGDFTVPLCITLYVSCVFGYIALIALYKLLDNINKEQVFIETNTKCLRIISWACMMAGITFLIFGLWRVIFVAIAFFSVMFGLIMRVLKNVFEKAVEIKSENDYTV